VNQAIAHAVNVLPRYDTVLGADFVGYFAGRFANNLMLLNQGQDQHAAFASERALWQLVEMPREARLDEGAQRGKRVLGSNVP
jgi:hypothetical protein